MFNAARRKKRIFKLGCVIFYLGIFFFFLKTPPPPNFSPLPHPAPLPSAANSFAGPGESPAEIVAGDLRIDVAARQVTRRDEPIMLTAREFDLLVFLASRPRHVVTRRSEEHTSELQSPCNLVCRLLLEKKQ